MTSRTSLLVSVLLVMAAGATIFAGMLAMGVITFAGPAPTGTPIAQPPTAQPTALSTAEPTAEPTPTAEPPPTEEPTAEPQPTPGGTYIVQPGDTLEGIGRRFGVPWPSIAQANGIEEPYTIRIGQELVIPAPDDTGVDPDADFYIVQPGDTLIDIAFELEVSTALLADVNNIDNWDEIYVGQRLLIPGRVPAESPTPEP